MEKNWRHAYHLFCETGKGKTLGRILVNCAIEGRALQGRVADLGAGHGRASHYRFLSLAPESAITTVSIDSAQNPDLIADLNAGVPLPDESCDAVLCFNLLEHLHTPFRMLQDAARILRPGGMILGSVPFLHPIHGDPDDFYRYTASALEDLLAKAGFLKREIRPMGWGPTSAAYTQIEGILPRAVRLLIIPFIAASDKLIAIIRPAHAKKFPLHYLFAAWK